MRRAIPPERLRELPQLPIGLRAAEVLAQRARYGPNDIVDEPPSGLARLLADTVRDPMIWFLVVTGAIYASIGQPTECAVLLASILPLVLMDAFLHRRTQISTRALSSRLAAWAEVERDGVVSRVPARDLVPGDLVLLASGDLLPADGLIIDGAELQLDESALSGEAVPVRKRPTSAPVTSAPDIAWASDEHWASAGTRVLTGRARVRIVLTGHETMYGEIVRSARPGAGARTPLQRAITSLVTTLLALATAICFGLAWMRWHRGFGLVDALVSAATLAVAAIPEEFPLVFTFFLGVGVYRLARRKALVRRAVVVENIGRVTCIATDKTGTLTEGRLRVAHCNPAEGATDDELLEVAALASRRETGDPLDQAILTAFGRPVVDGAVARFPFTEDRRRETAIVPRDDRRLRVVTKGAPEVVLAMCGLDADGRGPWQARTSELACTGHKVIACAERELDPTGWSGGEPDRDYRLVGLLACEDPVREGVTEAISAARAAGIRVLMITGDHPGTAGSIARDLALGGVRPRVVSAEELDHGLDLTGVDVVARALPSQKLALVRALQRAGEIVAVTGDGVNDVPALQAADVGIAMGERGTESAREIASIVLLDDNFRTIVGAIAEGQQLFRNLQLSFAYLMMVHVPLVATAALIPLAGYPLLYLPIHVVWLELIIHPTALLVFQELPQEVELRALRRRGAARFFDGRAWAVIAVVALLVTAALTLGYVRALGDGAHVEHARTMAMVTLITASATMTAGLSQLRTGAARLVVLATALSAVLLVQVEPLARFLHLDPLHADDWLLAGLAGALPALLGLTLRRHFAGRGSPDHRAPARAAVARAGGTRARARSGVTTSPSSGSH